MYTINWEKPVKETKNAVIIDIGDIRLLLKHQSNCWELNMGIRVYTNDRSSSMVRPPVNVARFPKSCDIDEAKSLTEKYINEFLSSTLLALTN